MKSIQMKVGSEKVYPHCYFPIGYIYLSTVNTNPSTWFGGTWEQIKDVFFLTAGSTYTAGKTGGSASHTHTNSSTGSTTLTSSHIPSHTHSVGAHSHGLNSHTHTFSATTNSKGGHTHSYDNLYLNRVDSELKGYGLTAIASFEGRPIISVDSAKEKKLQTAGAHTHSISGTSGAASGSTANSTAFNTGAWGATTVSGHTHTMSNTGSSSNLPPYLVVYAWKRTA